MIKKKKIKQFFLNNSKIKSNHNSFYDNPTKSYYHDSHSNYFNKSFKIKINKKEKSSKRPLTKGERISDKKTYKENNKLKRKNLKKYLLNTSSSFLTSEKQYLNSLVNKFKNNKSATTFLLNFDKKMPLNSLSNISNKSLMLLLSDEDNKNTKNNKTLKNEDKSISSKMIEIFNNRTSELLNCSKGNLRMFSEDKVQFGSDLVNYYKNIEFSNDVISKLKKKYNEAVDIYERQKSLQMKKALKEEKNFYRLKNIEDVKSSKKIYKRLLSINNRKKDDLRNSFILSGRKSLFFNDKNLKRVSMRLISSKVLTNSILERRENDKNNLNSLDLWKLNRHYSTKNILHNESEEKVYIAHKNFEKFKQKKIEQNAQKFSELINDMIYSNYMLKHSNYLDDESKKIRIINNNLMKLTKIKKFNTSMNKMGVDEFKDDYNKLREKMYKCEDEYYRVSSINNKYKLSYLRPFLRTRTIKKFLRMKDSSFGLP